MGHPLGLPKLARSPGVVGGIHSSPRWSCDLPGSLRLFKVTTSRSNEDVESITDSVSRRSDALETFRISCYSSGVFASAPD